MLSESPPAHCGSTRTDAAEQAATGIAAQCRAPDSTRRKDALNAASEAGFPGLPRMERGAEGLEVGLFCGQGRLLDRDGNPHRAFIVG